MHGGRILMIDPDGPGLEIKRDKATGIAALAQKKGDTRRPGVMVTDLPTIEVVTASGLHDQLRPRRGQTNA